MAQRSSIDSTNWKPHPRGQPANHVDGVPDNATVWARFEKQAVSPTSAPPTVTVYRAASTRDYVTLHRDDELVDVDSFEASEKAIKHVNTLLDEHSDE